MPRETVEKIDSPDQLENLRPDWNRLLSESDDTNPFSSFEWILSWWRAFGHAHRMYILVIKEKGRVVGIAPLKQTIRTGLFGAIKTISFLGTPNADYCDFIGIDKELIAERVVGYLKDNRQDWIKIELSQIPESTNTRMALLNSLKRHRFNFNSNIIETCLAFAGIGASDFRKGYLFSRSRSLKRSIKQLDEMGGLKLNVLTEPDDIRKHLSLFFQFHYNRWKGTSTPSKFNDYDNIVFYRELVDNMAPNGKIQLLTLTAGEQTLSYCFNFTANKIVYLYTLAHDCYLNSRSPGKILIYFQAEQFLSEGYREIDYMRGGEAYKSKLTNTERSNYRVSVFNNMLGSFGTVLYDRLKKIPPLIWLTKSHRISKFKQDITDYYNIYGPFKIILYIFGRIVYGLTGYHKTVKYVFKRNDELKIISKDECEIRQVGLDDLSALVSFYGYMEDSPEHKEFENKLKSGERCLAVLHDNTIKSAVWIDSNQVLKNLEVSPELLNPKRINDCLAVLSSVLDSKSDKPLYLEIPGESNLNSILPKAGFQRIKVSRHFGRTGE